MRIVEIRLYDAPLVRNKRRGFPFDPLATPAPPIRRKRAAPIPAEDLPAGRRRSRLDFLFAPVPDTTWYPFNARPRPLPFEEEAVSPRTLRHAGGVFVVGPAISYALPYRQLKHPEVATEEDPPTGRFVGRRVSSSGSLPVPPIIIPEPAPSPAGNSEVYCNLALTLVAAGGYTPGTGVLNVASTAAPFPQRGNFRVAISDPASDNPRVLLEVTGINSPTQFAVVAEGTDASGFVNDKVTAVLTAGALDAVRSDLHRVGAYASIPSTTNSKRGDEYAAADGYHFHFDGTGWVPYSLSAQMRKPVLADYTAVNAAGSAIADSAAGIRLRNAAAETGVNAYVIAAPAAPYTLIVRLAGYAQMNGSNTPGFGVCFRNSSSGKIEMLQVGNSNGVAIGVDYWTDATTFSSAIAAAKGFVISSDGIWLALQDDGVNKSFAWSVDGVNFETVFSEVRTANFTANQIGFCIRTDSAALIVASILKSWRVV